jgi:hypothetical protein
MSFNFNYDGSGNISFEYQTISSIINYKYQPPYVFPTISGFIYEYQTLSGFIPGSKTGQYINTISSSFPQYNFPLNNWTNDQTSNGFISTFIKGFLSISGNIIFQNNGSINNCQSFNGIPTSYFNKLLTSSDTYQSQINTISSVIQNQFNQNIIFNGINRYSQGFYMNSNLIYLHSDTNHFVGGNSAYNDGPYLAGYGGCSIGYRGNLNQLSVNNSGIQVNLGNISLNNIILSSLMISYLSNVTSDIQTQINNISGTPSGGSTESNNIWTGINNFTNVLQVSGTDILTRISNSVNGLLSSSNSWTNTNNFSTLQVSGTDILTRISNSVNGLLSSSNSWTNTNNFSTLQVSGTDILTRISNSVNGLLSSSNSWTGINSFSSLIVSNNLYNTVVSGNCFTIATTSSKNTIFGSDIMTSYNPSGADGGNIAFGRTVMQALRTGTFNVGIGGNALSGITNTSYNLGVGINAGNGVYGNYCTCIGTNTGQSVGVRLENSTAIGARAQFNDSNQIMLGTDLDTVVCPNILVVSGTNILTRISSQISTAFTNFLASANSFTNNNDFVGIIRFAGPNRGREIIIDNGVIKTLGLTTPADTANSGVIQCTGGISANAKSWFNGITTTALTCVGSFGNGPILRTGQIFVTSNTVFIESQMGINQLICASGSSTFTLALPDSTTCQNQTVYIYNDCSESVFIACSGSGRFVGKVNAKSYGLSSNGIHAYVSNYYNWIVVSI